ncbi:MAG: C-terminal binding protein [Spirochaetota bacterium]
MANYLVYVAETSYSDYSQERDVVYRAGGELRFARCRTEQDVIEQCADAHALLLRQVPVGERAFRALKELRVVARYGTGYDNVDVDAATRAGVVVTVVPDYCVGEAADHAAALLLSSIRRVAQRDRAVRAGGWDLTSSLPVHRTGGRILGLVGYGRIARELRRRLSGFPFRFVACSPRTEERAFAEDGTRRVDFRTLLLVSDYVSIHVPLNEETRRLFDLDAFRKMRRRAVLVNTSRGGVVDQKALYTALSRGYLAGAALDVFEDEPLAPTDPLLSLDSVLVTDHASWYSEESRRELQRRTAQEAIRVLNDITPENPVNPRVLEHAPRTCAPCRGPAAPAFREAPPARPARPIARPRTAAAGPGSPASLRRRTSFPAAR